MGGGGLGGVWWTGGRLGGRLFCSVLAGGLLKKPAAPKSCGLVSMVFWLAATSKPTTTKKCAAMVKPPHSGSVGGSALQRDLLTAIMRAPPKTHHQVCFKETSYNEHMGMSMADTWEAQL